MKQRHYTGIGSRDIPNEISRYMQVLAYTFAHLDFILRSGGADGSDSAFEEGCDKGHGSKEIYLPWRGYCYNDSPLYNTNSNVASEIAEEAYVGNWKSINSSVKKLMIRNVYQVLGQTLDNPSDFMVCWTPDGIEDGVHRTHQTGGTGQAITIATDNNVPIFNLYNNDATDRLLEFVEDL
jgi:hypothetical protein